MKDDQNWWNFVFSIIFVLQFLAAMYFLVQWNALPTAISFFDCVLIVFATYRMIRLFVYDRITQFVRDWFLNTKIIEGNTNEYIVVKDKPEQGPRRTIADLLSCPWCFGMWAALFISFIYFATPLAWYFIFVLAVSGMATLLQISSNLVGWRAEAIKQEVGRLSE